MHFEPEVGCNLTLTIELIPVFSACLPPNSISTYLIFFLLLSSLPSFLLLFSLPPFIPFFFYFLSLLGGIFLSISPYLHNLRKSSWSKPVPSQEILMWKGSRIWVETWIISTILPFAVLPKASNSAALALSICIGKMDMGWSSKALPALPERQLWVG